MTRGVPVLDPARDLAAATPEMLARALFRRTEFAHAGINPQRSMARHRPPSAARTTAMSWPATLPLPSIECHLVPVMFFCIVDPCRMTTTSQSPATT